MKKKRFEDTKGDIESCKSRDGQYSGQQKKGQKQQTTIYKTLHRKLRSSNMNPTKNDACTQVLRISKSGSTCGIVVLLQLQTGDKQ